MKSRVFVHVYYLWIFSFSDLKHRPAALRELLLAVSRKKTEKAGVEEEPKLFYCLWGGETGLEVTIAGF